MTPVIVILIRPVAVKKKKRQPRPRRQPTVSTAARDLVIEIHELTSATCGRRARVTTRR